MQLLKREESWSPFREFEDLSNRLNRLFGLSKTTGNGERETLALMDWSPSCDISENEKDYQIRAELPDVKKDNVHVTLENGVLTIQGERKEEKETKEEAGRKYHRRELTYGTFLRSFTMPDDADETKVDASFKDGILNVTIAKSKTKAPKAREIPVTAK